MKKQMSLVLVPVALAALALSGCASTPQAAERSARKYEPDREYIAAVKGAAKRMGLTIIWVNPPEKKADATEQ